MRKRRWRFFNFHRTWLWILPPENSATTALVFQSQVKSTSTAWFPSDWKRKKKKKEWAGFILVMQKLQFLLFCLFALNIKYVGVCEGWNSDLLSLLPLISVCQLRVFCVPTKHRQLRCVAMTSGEAQPEEKYFWTCNASI